MRTRAIVDLAALSRNYAEVVRLAGGALSVLCVVKANAYGHGALPVSRVLAGAGARHFAVASLDEAIELRNVAVPGAVLVLGGLEPGAERDAALRGIEPVIDSVDQLQRWNRTGRELSRKLACHLLLNTGMNRLGIDFVPSRPSRPDGLLAALLACPWVNPHGVATHFASAEDLRSRQTAAQERLFSRQLDALSQIRVIPRYVHAANSAALVHRRMSAGSSGARYTMVRPGLALYGYVKQVVGHDAAATNSLEPVLEWRARLMRVRDVRAGAPIGYGASYVTPRAMRVGVLSVGYGDGLDWRLSNRGAVSLHGAHCPIIGEISMDLTAIDLSAATGAREGDEAILLGAPPLDARSVASLNGDSAYQVLCRISNRVQRQYVTDAARR